MLNENVTLKCIPITALILTNIHIDGLINTIDINQLTVEIPSFWWTLIATEAYFSLTSASGKYVGGMTSSIVISYTFQPGSIGKVPRFSPAQQAVLPVRQSKALLITLVVPGLGLSVGVPMSSASTKPSPSIGVPLRDRKRPANMQRLHNICPTTAPLPQYLLLPVLCPEEEREDTQRRYTKITSLLELAARTRYE